MFCQTDASGAGSADMDISARFPSRSTTPTRAGPTGCRWCRSPSPTWRVPRPTDRDPDEILFTMPHLNRRLTVRLAAINAAMAGCLPEYFPVVLAAWEALTAEPYPTRGIWQSTTGTAPLLVVNGPVRERLGFNSQGNVFGSGFRANATIGRAIRLAAINVFGLHPHQLDQATQATPAKYSCCIAENEEESPWEPLHVEHGFAPADSTVTAMVFRSVIHIEARHTEARAARPRPRRHPLAHRRPLHETSSALRGPRPRARAVVRPGRLVQGRPAAVRLRARGELPRRTWPRSARTRSPSRPAGGCRPATRTPSRPRGAERSRTSSPC